MTIGAIAAAIGLIIDDAISVVEQITVPKAFHSKTKNLVGGSQQIFPLLW
jgi:multidrug efflux pump subunit AcrB